MSNLKRLLERVRVQNDALQREILLMRSRTLRLKAQMSANNKFINEWVKK